MVVKRRIRRPVAVANPPLPIAQLPFVDARRAALRLPDEPALECANMTPALDHELAYSVELSKLTALRATIFASGGVETGLALRRRSAPRTCVSSGREAIAVTLPKARTISC